MSASHYRNFDPNLALANPHNVITAQGEKVANLTLMGHIGDWFKYVGVVRGVLHRWNEDGECENGSNSLRLVLLKQKQYCNIVNDGHGSLMLELHNTIEQAERAAEGSNVEVYAVGIVIHI